MESNDKVEMKSLAKVMAKLTEDGYTSNFMVEENKLKLVDTDKTYSPEEVEIENFYRFEGESDPADTSILYAIKTNDGNKGMLTDAYGVYADDQVSEFIQSVENIKKETTPSHIKDTEE
jgi:hypothetical protein